ncbi:acyl dehydratase [Dactylosporangium roseum]|uniref:Acyl dehydratase n=1 Tax=Dactylosporangium roseum TaxID=47989 RepID=A0ABY5YY30_9ACTN|nr:MaoC/PaaZ C-terminal domain-containing protein [Dactylosporangium roseum]UWZ34442.1 acyl dehydratase [Dactylosporangium roseum]
MPIDTLPATRRVADVAVGTELPPLVIPLTVTKIVATAIATRDYALVHHDQATARERGLQDIIVNILTSNGLVGRLVTDWAGPNAVLKKVAIRLGVSAYPGDDLTLSGTVTEIDGNTVTIAVTGAVPRGNHVTGTVLVDLPN